MTLRRSLDDTSIKKGYLDVILGPMSSGKSKELLRRLTTTAIVSRVLYINNYKDKRLGASKGFSTHDPHYKAQSKSINISMLKDELENNKFIEGESLNNIIFLSVENLRDIDINLLDKCDIDTIGIDEAQFFTDLYVFCQDATDNHRKHVIVAGLDGDRERKKFGQTLDIIPLSDTVVKLSAICRRCGRKQEPAPFTYYIKEDGNKQEQTIIGGMEEFMGTCRNCYLELMKK